MANLRAFLEAVEQTTVEELRGLKFDRIAGMYRTARNRFAHDKVRLTGAVTSNVVGIGVATGVSAAAGAFAVPPLLLAVGAAVVTTGAIMVASSDLNAEMAEKLKTKLT